MRDEVMFQTPGQGASFSPRLESQEGLLAEEYQGQVSDWDEALEAMLGQDLRSHVEGVCVSGAVRRTVTGTMAGY